MQMRGRDRTTVFLSLTDANICFEGARFGRTRLQNKQQKILYKIDLPPRAWLYSDWLN